MPIITLSTRELALCTNVLSTNAFEWKLQAQDKTNEDEINERMSLANERKELAQKLRREAKETSLLNEVYDALSLLLQDVEDVACDPLAYGFPVEDEQHPFHESVLKAREALRKLRGI